MVPFADNLGDFFNVVGCFIQFEMQLGDMLQVQVFAESASQVAFGAVQSLNRFFLFFLTAHNTDIHPGILEVVAQLDSGDRDETDTGILQTVLNQFGDFLKEQFLNSL